MFIIWSVSLVRNVDTGSVSEISSSFMTTKYCVVLTTRRGWSLLPSPPILLLKWQPSNTTTTTDTFLSTTTLSYHLHHHLLLHLITKLPLLYLQFHQSDHHSFQKIQYKVKLLKLLKVNCVCI